MRPTILAVLLLIAPILRGEEVAYVILDAVKYPKQEHQPTWIALLSGRKLIHVPTGQLIVPLAPGKYKIHHIDFQKSITRGEGSIVPARRPNFSVLPGSTTFVGVLLIESRGRYKHVIKIFDRDEVFPLICSKKPELLSQYPIHLTRKDAAKRIVRVKCET